MFKLKNQKSTNKNKRWKVNPIGQGKNKVLSRVDFRKYFQGVFDFFFKHRNKHAIKKWEKKKTPPKLVKYIQQSITTIVQSVFQFDYRDWLVAGLSGFLAGLCLLNNQMQFAVVLSWFALSPLFIVLFFSKSLYKAFGLSFFAGFVFNFVNFRFLLGIHPLSWLGVPDNLSLITAYSGLMIASLQQALYGGVYGLLLRLLTRVNGFTYWTTIQSSIIWVVWHEKIANALSLGGIPWTSYYYTQANNPYILQIADLFGGSLISFLLIQVNLTLALFIITFSPLCRNLPNKYELNLDVSIFSGFQSIIFLALAFIYGINAYYKYDGSIGENTTVTALLMQKNLSVEESRFSAANNNYYLNLFKSLLAQRIPDLLVLPEGAVGKSMQVKELFNQIESISPITNLIGGVYLVEDGKYYNAALGFRASKAQFSKVCHLRDSMDYAQQGGENVQAYWKQALVPFGEYVPFEKDLIRLVKSLKLERLVDGGFSAGNKAQAFEFKLGKISPLICFELIFPEIYHGQIKAGAQAVAVLGDVSWFNEYKESVSSQMISIAKVRAVEGRRDILISVNKGPLLRVDKVGRVRSYTRNKEFLFAKFEMNSTRTMATQTLAI